MSYISAGTTITTSLVQGGDTTGNLIFATGNANTTALTITNTQNATFANAVTATGNVTGANILTAGNVTGANITATGNVTAGNITVSSTANFVGTSSAVAALFTNIAEVANVSATVATGTVNLYLASQGILYYTSNASANFTLNISHSATTTLNNALSTGQSVSVAFLNTNGATPYYANVYQVDGSNITPKWQNNSAPTSGNASSTDVYTLTVIKTGATTFVVLGSLTQFK